MTIDGLLQSLTSKEDLMTARHRFKNYFNWAMHDKNPVIEARNFHLLWVTVRTITILMLISIPVVVYTYVVYQNSNLSYYINYRYAGKPIWLYLNLPNGKTIEPLLWIGYGFLFFSFGLLFFFKPLVTGQSNKWWKFGGIAIFAIAVLIAMLFFGLSQYKYSQFQDFYYYEYFSTGSGWQIKEAWAREIAKEFRLDNQYNTDTYNWEATAVVWWVLICQVMVIFALIVGLQNAVYERNLGEEHYVSREDSNQAIIVGRFSRKINNLFKNNDRNVSIFMSIVAGLVIIPNLIYSVLSTTNGTNLNALVAWSYKIPMFLQDNIDQSPLKHLEAIKDSYYGSLFVIGSLPLIMLGLTVATLFFFLAALFRGENLSDKIFIFETIILFVYLLILISTMFVSKIYMDRLETYWNAPINNTTRAGAFFADLKQILINDGPENKDNPYKDYDLLIGHFKVGDMLDPKGFKIEWLAGPAMIGEAIVSYSFVFGTFTILGYDIFKLTMTENRRANYQVEERTK